MQKGGGGGGGEEEETGGGEGGERRRRGGGGGCVCSGLRFDFSPVTVSVWSKCDGVYWANLLWWRLKRHFK